MTWKKINKAQARKIFNNFGTVYLLPSNMSTESNWGFPYGINQDEELTFEGAVNAFRYYNCNNELGRNVHYFIKSD